MVPKPYRYGNTKFLIQIGDGNAAIQSGGELPVVRGGGSIMTHGAGSVTTQSIALK